MKLTTPETLIIYDIDGGLLERAYDGNRLAISTLCAECACLIKPLTSAADTSLMSFITQLKSVHTLGIDPDKAFGWRFTKLGRPAKSNALDIAVGLAAKQQAVTKLAGDIFSEMSSTRLEYLDAMEWLLSCLKRFADGLSPNHAFRWHQAREGRPKLESPMLPTLIKQEVQRLMRAGMSKNAAINELDETCDGLPISLKSIWLYTEGISKSSHIEDCYFPIHVRSSRRIN